MKKLLIQLTDETHAALEFMARQNGLASATALVTEMALSEASNADDYAKRILAKGSEADAQIIGNAMVRARIAAEDYLAKLKASGK